MRLLQLTKIFVLALTVWFGSSELYPLQAQSEQLLQEQRTIDPVELESQISRTASADTVYTRGEPTPMPNRIVTRDTNRLMNNSTFVISPVSLTTTVNGFSNDFAPPNWTFDDDGGDSSVDVSGAPGSITLTGADDQSNSENNTTYCITIPGSNSGLLRFNWNFETFDNDGPLWDPMGYIVNGNVTQLTDNGGADIQSGSVEFSINAGDQFCFLARSVDQLFGEAITVFSSFSFTPRSQEIFTTTGTWTAPAGVTEITVEAWGGGGGGAATAGNNDGMGGGGGGAYVRSELTVIPGNEYTIQIGTSGGIGLPGGDSFFDSMLIIVARGGLNAIESTGGLGGSAALSLGDVRFAGGNGGGGQTAGGNPNTRTGGGGGGSAFTNADGANGGNGQSNNPGTGGSGTGFGGNGGPAGGNGQIGQTPGGGGGGGGRQGNSAAGADGQIIISYEIGIVPDPDQTTITTNPESILADGVSTSQITVQAVDADGTNINSGGALVTLSATDGTLSAISDNADGTYTATLTSSTEPGTVTVSGTINGDPITDTAEVEFTPESGLTYFSRQSGDFNNPDSWSFSGHDGVSAGFAPGPNDFIFIGGNSSVNHTITLVEDISINAPGELTVRDTGDGAGVLATGSFTVSGSGQFILEAGANIQIGSPAGITESSADGNIQTADRSFSIAGNYIYNGTAAQVTGSGLPIDINRLTIDNTNSVTAVQSYRVNGTLFLTTGALVIGDGLSLIANTKDVNSGELIYQLEISGQPGYRMLSSPINTNFDNFLSGVLTQGYTGASLAGDLQPNVLWYEESFPGTDNQRWRAPNNAAEQVNPGRGFHVFMFGDVPEDSRYNEPLPYLLEVNGLENEGTGGEIDLDVTYTEEADTGWNMVGNPYGAAIDWEHPSWTKINIDPAIYVWDPNTNQYLTWNGSAGDISDGILAPFQGFWVKANDENPELIISEDAKTFGGSFAGKELYQPETPVISINALYSRRYQSTAHFTFSETGSYSLDKKDAYKLLPPPGISDYLEVYSLTNNGERLAINNMPRRFGSDITIPFSLNAFKDGFPITDEIKLNIRNFEHIPESWDVEIVNEQTGERFDLRQYKSIPVSMSHLKSQTNSKAHTTGFEVVTRDKNSHVQFKLIIRPGSDATGLPNTFELKQNYPNPFNPTTTFRFDLPIQSSVKIDIYDMLGRRVATLVDGTLPAGSHDRVWDASRFSSGVYVSRMVTDNGVFVKKMTLIK
jgi:hypothetical protein